MKFFEESRSNTLYFLLAKVPKFMDKIVGGVTAASPIPWQVSVRRGTSHFCGGTILNKWTILSAAHCFPSSFKGNYSILAGVVDRANLTNCTSAQVNKCTIVLLLA